MFCAFNDDIEQLLYYIVVSHMLALNLLLQGRIAPRIEDQVEMSCY